MNRFLSKNIILPAVFALRRENVLRICKDLEQTQWHSPEQVTELQFLKLKNLIRHAYREVPYYTRLFDEHGVKPNTIQSPADLKRLPLLEKSDLKKLAATIRFPSLKSLKYSVRKTSGTSGIPATLYVSRNANAHSLAARYRCFNWYDIKLGDKEARFGGRSLSASERAAEILKDTILNRLRIQHLDLTKNNINDARKNFFRFLPDYLYGYPSLILRFGESIGSESLSALRLKAVVSTAEMTMDYERKRMQELFGCPAADEYGCSEVDIIAFECPHGKRHIMAENVFVEINRKQLEDGTGEIVITDLNNLLMPLIRYRLKDIILPEEENCSCGRGLPILGKIIGRSQDQYIKTENGDLIHSVIFAYFFESLTGREIPIKRFRIIQNNMKRLTIQISLEQLNVKTVEKIKGYMQAEIDPILPESLGYDVEYVDEIITEGKFSFFESLSK